MGKGQTAYKVRNGHTFTYDTQGRRLSKNDTTFTYDSQGRVVKQDNALLFFYDHTGVVGFQYGPEYYAYRKDAQGNIIAILDRRGNVVAFRINLFSLFFIY